jgi:hypothetical protein
MKPDKPKQITTKLTTKATAKLKKEVLAELEKEHEEKDLALLLKKEDDGKI